MKNAVLSTLMLAILAIIGISTPLSAQCSGGGCGSGGCGGGAATGGCPSGGCPGGGCPSGNKMKRVEKPAGGGVARGPAVADPENVPGWQRASSDVIESAAKDERPIIVYFPSENADDMEFYGKEIAELSKADAVFVKMPYNADREASPYATESVVPTSKLLSDNPARDYKVAVGKATVLVCDWHGNEFYRTEPSIKADKLGTMIKEVSKKVTDLNDKLQKNLDKAKQYVDSSDRKNALKMLLKNFGEGVVGVSAQEDSIRLYHEVMDGVRTQIADLEAKGDKEGLKNLAKDIKKTDAEADVEAAIKKLS